MLYYIADFGFLKPSNIYAFNKLIQFSTNLLYNFNKKKDVLVLGGDNFYPDGINKKDCKDVNLFSSIFGEINDKIYGCLGNHDYYGCINSQINNSLLFYLPNNYYRKDYNSKYSLVIIDTVLLSSESDTNIDQVYYQFKNELKKNKITKQDKEVFLLKKKQEQLTWLDNELNLIKKQNKVPIVFGHYPIFTNGFYSYNNNCNSLITNLLPLFVKHDIKLYISGHDHSTQFHILKNTDLLELYNSNIMKCSFSDNSFIKKLCPNFKKTLENSQYSLYNIVSGACIDNYYKGQFINQVIEEKIDNRILFEDYINNLYLQLDLQSKYINLTFIHNSNYSSHEENNDIQYKKYESKIIL